MRSFADCSVPFSVRQHGEYSLLQAIRDRCGDIARSPRRWRSLRQVASDAWEFFAESTPARKRQRWGDLDFDCDHRVNTTSAGQGFLTRLRAALAGAPYQPSEPALFHEMLTALPIDYTQFTFIDIGSGKGRALLMAADYPFRRVIGVELLPELHAIAAENIRRYRGPQQKCFAIESRCGDARVFEFPLEQLVVYLFNPLPEAALKTLIATLCQSVGECPRSVFLIYHNPEHEHLLAQFPSFSKFGGTHQYAIYECGPQAWALSAI